MRRLVLVLATAVRGEVEYTDMQKWAGLLAQSFLAHSDDASHAHSQLASFKELVNTKARAGSRPLCTLCSAGCDLVYCHASSCEALQISSCILAACATLSSVQQPNTHAAYSPT